MPVRARQGPKLVVCAKTHDSGDAEVRPNADHEKFCHMQRLIEANRGYLGLGKIWSMGRDPKSDRWKLCCGTWSSGRQSWKDRD
jgi:hypothetical protein